MPTDPKLLAASRRYKKAHPERIREQSARWRVRNRERLRTYGNALRSKNIDARRESERKLYSKHREKLRERMRNRSPETKAKYAAKVKNSSSHNAVYRKRHGLPEPLYPRTELCECCGKVQPGKNGFALDHCHETGKFRGWLCVKCNVGIGLLGDTVDGLAKAMNYLMKSADRK